MFLPHGIRVNLPLIKCLELARPARRSRNQPWRNLNFPAGLPLFKCGLEYPTKIRWNIPNHHCLKADRHVIWFLY